ncbi:MAG: hypothetical protein SGJ19_00360 [Planctomycetia bacterium]|nr:hypothetical protein [Planctomycetia bacterium]
MARIRCNKIEAGLRSSEVVARFKDYRGREHFIRVEEDFLTKEDETYFLPIGVVQVDIPHQAALIELPHEAETGANRIWVKQEQLDEPIEALA